MRQATFVLLTALAWSTAGTCAEPPMKTTVVDVAGVQEINAIDVAINCWTIRAQQDKRECRATLPVEECPTSASWTGL